ALVFVFVLRLTRGRWLPAVVTGLLFGIHPVHVESVAWVSERKDVLYAVLFIGGCITALRYLDGGGGRWVVVTFGLFVLACLAKAMAVVFPGVLLLLVYWRSDRGARLDTMIKRVPVGWWVGFLATSVLFGLIALNVQGGGDAFGVLEVLHRGRAL